MERKPIPPQEIADRLNLTPLSMEGGMFRRTWESQEAWQGKPAGTAIYFLLTENSFSHLHRLSFDEVYHFYLGDPVELSLLGPNGEVRQIVLGNDQYALLGTTMSPGYADEDYEHGDGATLKAQYPTAADIIDRLTGEAVYL